MGGAEETVAHVTIPVHEHIVTGLTLKRGDVSATISWDDERFLFRFHDARPEAAGIGGAAQEYEFSWVPKTGVNVKEP